MGKKRGRIMVDSYNIGVEEYGYPSIDLLGRGHIRITQGWFFPDIHPDEPAWYLDYYFDERGQCELILDGCWVHFDFWTPLKDYQMGFISGTFAENFNIPSNVSMNEICIIEEVRK